MPKRSHDVITIGSALWDTFLTTEEFQEVADKRFSTGYGECFALGSKIEVDEAQYGSGGGATNAAATFATLGYKTACVARVGDDLFGQRVLEELTEYGIDAKHVVVVKKGKTGSSVILTTPSGKRVVLVHRGVSSMFPQSTIPWNLLQKTEWVYLTSLGGDCRLAEKVIAVAKKGGARVAWNPGRAELEHHPDTIMKLLRKDVDIFNVNREEAQLLAGESSDDIRKLFSHFFSDSNRIRIITDGDHGAYLCNGASCYHSGTTSTRVVSATGAGDAFGSGVVASLMRGDPIYMALQVGTLNAEGVIQSPGAKTGILTHFPSAKKLAGVPIRSL